MQIPDVDSESIRSSAGMILLSSSRAARPQSPFFLSTVQSPGGSVMNENDVPVKSFWFQRCWQSSV